MNIIAVTGNICKDMKLEYTKNNKEVLTNTIAVPKGIKNEQTGQYESDFIEFVCFEKKANYLNQYATKGSKVEIAGKLRVDNWKDDEGKSHSRTYIVADSINILSNTKKNEPTIIDGKTPIVVDDVSDLPF